MRTFLVGYKGDGGSDAWLLAMDFKVINQSGSFLLWARFSEEISHEQYVEFGARGYHRIFESCFVVQPAQSELRQEVIHLLFLEMAGDSYNATIDIKMNVGCYEALYWGGSKLCLSPIKKILDFGCGPGTALASPIYQQAEVLLGFDFVRENQEHAREIGLNVLDTHQLDGIELGYFDLVVCCYVLHYRSVEIEMISKIFDRLRIGGVWAANFHKSEGVSWFLESLPNHFDIEIEMMSSIFGEIMYARKVGSL